MISIKGKKPQCLLFTMGKKNLRKVVFSEESAPLFDVYTKLHILKSTIKGFNENQIVDIKDINGTLNILAEDSHYTNLSNRIREMLGRIIIVLNNEIDEGGLDEPVAQDSEIGKQSTNKTTQKSTKKTSYKGTDHDPLCNWVLWHDPYPVYLSYYDSYYYPDKNNNRQHIIVYYIDDAGNLFFYIASLPYTVITDDQSSNDAVRPLSHLSIILSSLMRCPWK